MTRMRLVASCTDTTKAQPLPPTLIEDDSGLLSRFRPLISSINGNPLVSYTATGGVITDYREITNSHASKTVTVKVAVSIQALAAGTQTCDLTFEGFGQDQKVDLTFEVVAATTSEVSIKAVDQSNMDIYAGESFAVELDVTVTPWSGSETLNFKMHPDPSGSHGFPYWKICHAEIIDVTDDLIGMNNGQYEYVSPEVHAESFVYSKHIPVHNYAW